MSRIIMHIDMNSYFASVEQQANPLLRGKPIGITGKAAAKKNSRLSRSVVATASIEAKRLGVKTAMSTWEAERICPSLILIAGDPAKYAEITQRFNDIYKKFSDKIQRFSVDESFLDITEEAQDYFGATMTAQMIREQLRKECGDLITASVGIGPNKLIAKLSSERIKPNGLTVTKPKDVLALMDDSELRDVCGIGSRIEQRLHALGITSFKHLRQYPLHLLLEEFNSYGYWLHEAAHGRDASPVESDEAAPKSIGHSYTLPADSWDPEEIQKYLLGLCDKVGWRMRRDGYATQCVSTYIRFGDFAGTGRERRLSESVNDGLKLFKIAWGLIDPLLRKHNNRLSSPVRLVGISASRLIQGKEQPTLFPRDQKFQNILPALDKIQHRYGMGSWTRASLLSTNIRERTSGFAYDHEL